MSGLRIGIGYDVHALVPGRKLILGGVELEHHLGLDGHSDADVLVHAIMDALLGAARLGDIGQHFPPDDPTYKDANSLTLLLAVVELLRANGFEIADIDTVIIAEQPKLAPAREQMRANIAAAASIPVENIGIKATTTETLGFTGRQEGIAAQAVCLLRGGLDV
jgi:2-C-methyl-D-erythritol 2,4-cyclodiphosphate synthase